MKKIYLVFILTILLSVTVNAEIVKRGFTQGIILNVDNEEYYFEGIEVSGGGYDFSGHYWKQTKSGRLMGKLYNEMYEGKLWSSNSDEGKLLYNVQGIIDIWSLENALMYKEKGYVHYHTLISKNTQNLHPTKVVWLRHRAKGRFTLDGGPNPEFSHHVKSGIDYEFIPNALIEYMA